MLDDYTLGPGVVESLAKVMERDPDIINTIQLSSNGLRDAELASLLRAANKLTIAKTIIIKNNSFMADS
jgi:hypothetical protein